MKTFEEFCATDTLQRLYYGSHRPALYRALLATRDDKRPVLELGMGDTSTQLLHDCCDATGRRLFSVETDDSWREKLAHLAVGFHVFAKEPPNEFPIESMQWSVALIDHAPANDRYRELDRLADRCVIIVIHDVGSCCWPMASLKQRFKYAVEDLATPGLPPTGVVSNTFDVSGWMFP